MAVKLDILNIAATELEEPLLASEDDKIEHGRVLNAMYDLTLKRLLEDYDWNFARKRVALALDNITPVYGWSNRFPLPADYIKLRAIEDNLDYSIESGFLVANDSVVRIMYTFNQQNVGSYSGQFIDYFALKLAERAAGRLTGKTRLRTEIRGALVQSRRLAIGQNVAEDNANPVLQVNLWADARRTGVTSNLEVGKV